jgi:hypothetical protein
MKRIYKYNLARNGERNIDMPKDSKILSTIGQHGCIVLYAMVDDDSPEEREIHTIITIGTGRNADSVENCRFIGTVSLYGGNEMYHVFEKQNIS